ncbi:hypothetical protein GUJ93_ZPchr0007g4965 [Zizania palustris]|uniref:Uncharacterized protein n=1 Tax=Zizania palustris TaxID=103762 RepID=A0A8J5T6E8_ZIZPA|nr:hypothetical protein GUJ93_ZPchr0007g4965 [Zizania palustris]
MEFVRCHGSSPRTPSHVVQPRLFPKPPPLPNPTRRRLLGHCYHDNIAQHRAALLVPYATPTLLLLRLPAAAGLHMVTPSTQCDGRRQPPLGDAIVFAPCHR